MTIEFDFRPGYGMVGVMMSVILGIVLMMNQLL